MSTETICLVAPCTTIDFQNSCLSRVSYVWRWAPFTIFVAASIYGIGSFITPMGPCLDNCVRDIVGRTAVDSLLLQWQIRIQWHAGEHVVWMIQSAVCRGCKPLLRCGFFGCMPMLVRSRSMVTGFCRPFSISDIMCQSEVGGVGVVHP